MTVTERAAEIRGKTMRWTWTDGPTKGTVHEHAFHEDGTVEWRAVAPLPTDKRPAGAKPGGERPEYAAMRVAPDIFLVSYRAASGYTLTVVLEFGSRELQGIASGATDWHPVRGTFEVIEQKAALEQKALHDKRSC
jgi:hypothetical protein